MSGDVVQWVSGHRGDVVHRLGDIVYDVGDIGYDVKPYHPMSDDVVRCLNIPVFEACSAT